MRILVVEDEALLSQQIAAALGDAGYAVGRASGQVTPELRWGRITLDPRGARVTLDGVPVRLTSHEFRVLSYLMHHRGPISYHFAIWAHSVRGEPVEPRTRPAEMCSPFASLS